MLPVTPTTSGWNWAAPPRRELMERGELVIDHDDRDVAERGERDRIGLGGHEEGGRAGHDGLAQEPMSIRPLSGQRHEQLARSDDPRVNRGAVDPAMGIAYQAPSRDGNDVRRGQGFRTGLAAGLDDARGGCAVGVGHAPKFGTGTRPGGSTRRTARLSVHGRKAGHASISCRRGRARPDRMARRRATRERPSCRSQSGGRARMT